MNLVDSVIRCARRMYVFFFFQAEDGIRDKLVTGVQTCALPILGSNNLDTTFAGVIQEDGGTVNGSNGSLTKTGTGSLTLSGASTYEGGTTVTQGAVWVTNTMGSATGTGLVEVNAGILGGKGIIAGAVTIGTGGGAGAFLAPGAGAQKTNNLTVQGALTNKTDWNYNFKSQNEKGRAK